MDERKMIQMTAAMEGQATVIKNLGRKHMVSEMELICLCNFANLGLLEVFRELEGQTGYKASLEIDQLRESIRRTFATKQNPDGLARLAQSCTAILCEHHLSQWIIGLDDQPEETADERR